MELISSNAAASGRFSNPEPQMNRLLNPIKCTKFWWINSIRIKRCLMSKIKGHHIWTSTIIGFSNPEPQMDRLLNPVKCTKFWWINSIRIKRWLMSKKKGHHIWTSTVIGFCNPTPPPEWADLPSCRTRWTGWGWTVTAMSYTWLYLTRQSPQIGLASGWATLC